jgi:hypothetical protein
MHLAFYLNQAPPLVKYYVSIMSTSRAPRLKVSCSVLAMHFDEVNVLCETLLVLVSFQLLPDRLSWIMLLLQREFLLPFSCFLQVEIL